jgi:antitoxin (DNA-binding transcriptional repressor) of toxin-antitoxin stability system
MDEVKKSGASLTITKHGKPVAKLVPATSEVQPLFGYMKQHGSVKILGDITEPIDVDWEAQP